MASKGKGRAGSRPLVSPSTIARVDAIKESSRVFLQKTAQEKESSSSESDDEDSGEVVLRALSGYCSELNGAKTSTELLKVALHDHSCLICLSGMRRFQAVWNCRLCYCMFHFMCIQQWARDGVVTKNPVLSKDLFPNVAIKWSCPKCRGEYDQADTPLVYKCFCGKKVDPPPDPWLLAHSCGEVCGRDLVPVCGHKCMTLCHPGLCPPCPKTIEVSCYCKRSPKLPQRCGLPGWSCNKICKKILNCSLHTCEKYCHQDSCDPCDEQVMQTCSCGKQVQKRLCNDEPHWSCGIACDRMLACGRHFCQRECHAGTCGDCPRSGEKSCPCGGKSCVTTFLVIIFFVDVSSIESFILDCTVEVSCCGDTCSKSLNCGKHLCVRKCHYGDCGPCLQKTGKNCRCGQKTKSVSCNQELLCESRCQRMKQCGRHQCRKKCCNGNCTRCEQVCVRVLGCKTHKCPAPCHSGRCYPCVLTVPVRCVCGKTSMTVPCGRERTTRPPRCNKPCLQPPKCHHAKTTPHHCHLGDCPPCQLTCSLALSCNHLCTATCHSSPAVSHVKPIIPWEKAELSVIVKPCPPCYHPVSKYCLGEHKVEEFACSKLHEYSCGQLCGRILRCSNHRCKRLCHLVINASTPITSGDNCLQCEEPCRKFRPPECCHQCPLPCHQGDCPPCTSLFKVPCHCTSINIYIKCSDWCNADETQREHMKTCNSQCSKKLSCGHSCMKSCHPGSCSSTHLCRRRVTIRCPCRRIKKEWHCNERQDLVCNEECFLALQKQKEAIEKAAADALVLKKKEEKESLQALERKIRPRQRRSKVMEIKDQPNSDISIRAYVLKLTVGLVVLIFIAYIIGHINDSYMI